MISDPFTFKFSITLWLYINSLTDFEKRIYLIVMIHNQSHISLTLRVCNDRSPI